MRPRSEAELPVVVGKSYDFSLWLIQKVEHFPRSYRFSIGDRLVGAVIDLLAPSGRRGLRPRQGR